MIVEEYPRSDLERLLAGTGLCIRTGPVVTRIRSDSALVANGIALHYARHQAAEEAEFADFDVEVRGSRGMRRYFRRQIRFHVDGRPSFQPLPMGQAFPTLEWGMNWCVSTQCHQFVILHAAVVERNGRAMILPAPPGSGKSTLCAGLIHSGWRLLSDELALIDPQSGFLTPIPRPVSLKNASIAVISRFAPMAAIGPPVHDTIKGSVAHMRPPAASVEAENDRIAPGWIVMPRFRADAQARLTPLSKGRAFMQLVDNAFNYEIHGARGFDVLTRVMDRCEAFDFEYSDLSEAVALFREVSERPPELVA